MLDRMSMDPATGGGKRLALRHVSGLASGILGGCCCRNLRGTAKERLRRLVMMRWPIICCGNASRIPFVEGVRVGAALSGCV